MTTRRDLLLALGGALAAPLAFGQPRPAGIARIGYVDTTSAPDAPRRADVLREALRELGHVEGRNIAIEYRWAEGKYERLPALVADLMRLKVDVIVAAGTASIEAARRATSTIPIVMAATGDPLRSGFVASLARPGGNITGLSNSSGDLSRKYLELLRVAVPKLSRVAVLVNPSNPINATSLGNIETAGRMMGVSVAPVQASISSQIGAAFGTIKREHLGALIVLLDGFFISQQRQIAEHALKDRLPAMFGAREGAEAGGLMSYGQDLAEHFRRAAAYVDKILKGARPGDLPIEQPTTIELVVNLKTAKAIGLTVSRDLLFRADKVIE